MKLPTKSMHGNIAYLIFFKEFLLKNLVNAIYHKRRMNWKSRIPEKEKIYQQVIEYLALIEMLLIHVVPETNVATQRYGAQVIRGEMKNSLLDGDSQNYDLDRGFTRHPIDDNFGQGVVVKLASPYIINCIKLLLWDRDMRYCLFS